MGGNVISNSGPILSYFSFDDDDLTFINIY